MTKLSNLTKRYVSPTKSKYFVAYDDIDASSKWAQYSIDEVKIKKLMETADFTDKFDAEKALTIVRRKVDYMYKHRNFNLSEATAYYKKLKRAINF